MSYADFIGRNGRAYTQSTNGQIRRADPKIRGKRLQHIMKIIRRTLRRKHAKELTGSDS